MTEIGKRGVYEGTDKEGHHWSFPRHVDPAIDGTKLAEHHQPIFDVRANNDSVPVAEFDVIIEAAVPPDVLRRIERTIESGKLLAARGLADTPPISETDWRRGMILSWSHARDLVVVHDALGHPRDVKGHDVDEVVLAKHLQTLLADASGVDQWYRDYVNSLDEGAWVNVGFFNPHISASLYKWGDDKSGVQNAMDAHRLAAHHQGSTEHPLHWVERAVNFVVHHIPREHLGIRHEPRGNWSDLERRLAEDPAIKNATIGKVIARDAAKLFELLEQEGKVIPWQLLKLSHDTVTPSMIEHAHLLVLATRQNTAAKDVEELEPRRLENAHALLRRLPLEIEAAKREGQHALAAQYQTWLAEHG
ncbi:hypothetical protein HP062_18050 [Pseudomonas sp. B14-6]|uniref:hypothetical protein n=1 Tax=Pseudomonas sp. B14-6 TaxID=2738843 RepID=UPI00155F4ECC|nr:hypothetical protein [Pseudomonas sp. B14-6]QKG67328.1 hypothetical protein HP062_18050 [Pseudomonas sp. B14-6]